MNKPRPEPTPAAPVTGKKIVVGQKLRLDVYFKRNTPKLLSDSYLDLDDVVAQLRAQPTLRIRLEGHTDIIGNAAQHQRLSEQRVVAIKKYLVKNGISAKRIEVIGYGDTQLIKKDCAPPQGCPENRRVELVGVAP